MATETDGTSTWDGKTTTSGSDLDTAAPTRKRSRLGKIKDRLRGSTESDERRALVDQNTKANTGVPREELLRRIKGGAGKDSSRDTDTASVTSTSDTSTTTLGNTESDRDSTRNLSTSLPASSSMTAPVTRPTTGSYFDGYSDQRDTDATWTSPLTTFTPTDATTDPWRDEVRYDEANKVTTVALRPPIPGEAPRIMEVTLQSGMTVQIKYAYDAVTRTHHLGASPTDVSTRTDRPKRREPDTDLSTRYDDSSITDTRASLAEPVTAPDASTVASEPITEVSDTDTRATEPKRRRTEGSTSSTSSVPTTEASSAPANTGTTRESIKFAPDPLGPAERRAARQTTSEPATTDTSTRAAPGYTYTPPPDSVLSACAASVSPKTGESQSLPTWVEEYANSKKAKYKDRLDKSDVERMGLNRLGNVTRALVDRYDIDVNDGSETLGQLSTLATGLIDDYDQRTAGADYDDMTEEQATAFATEFDSEVQERFKRRKRMIGEAALRQPDDPSRAAISLAGAIRDADDTWTYFPEEAQDHLMHGERSEQNGKLANYVYNVADMATSLQDGRDAGYAIDAATTDIVSAAATAAGHSRQQSAADLLSAAWDDWYNRGSRA